MLAKNEVKEKYGLYLKEHMVRKDSNEKRFAEAYMSKAMHNLELAGTLDLISRDEVKCQTKTSHR